MDFCDVIFQFAEIQTISLHKLMFASFLIIVFFV